MKKVSSVERYTLRLVVITEYIAAFLVICLVLANLMQVFFRYVISKPLGWTEEFMRYTLVWIVYIVAGAVLYRGEHMTIDILTGSKKKWLLDIRKILILLLVGLYCIILIGWGIPLSIRNLSQVSPSAGISMFIPYISVVTGGVLTLLKVIALIIILMIDNKSRNKGS